MTTPIAYRLYDAQLAADVLRVLRLDSTVRFEGTLADIETFRSALASTPWHLEIRVSSPEQFVTSPRTDAIVVFVHNGSALLVTRRGRRLKLDLPNGSIVTMTAAAAIAALAPSEHAAMATRRRILSKRGASAAAIRAAEQHVDPRRLDAIAGWLEAAESRQSAPILDLARQDPGLLPFSEQSGAGLREDGFDLHCFELHLVRKTVLGSDHSPWRPLLRAIASERHLVAAVCALAVLGMPLGFAGAMIGAYIIDSARSVASAPTGAFAVLAGVLVLAHGAALVQQLAAVRLTTRAPVRITRAFLLRILGSRIDSVRKLSDGDLVARYGDLLSLQGLVLGEGVAVVLGSALLVGGVVYLFAVAPFTVVPTLLAIAVAAGLVARHAPALRESRRRFLAAGSEYRTRAIERIEGRRVLRHMDPFDRHLAVMDHALARCTECAQQSTEIGARLAAWLGFVGLAYMATVTWLGADRLQEGRLTLGLLAVVVGAAMSTLQMLMQMGGLVQQLTAAEPALARVREVFAATEPEPHDEVLTRRDGSPATLRVEDLHFAWPGGVPVLRGATFTLAPSSWTALLGESGSGKSTVAAIMAGLVEPQHGKIVVDGWELARYSPRALRSRIAVVNQEPFLLNRSLRENLRLASRGASEDEMLKALVLAGLADFLDRQPRGLDQPVGDNGAQMSHGERCRLSLARVLLQRPGLVVLDEALTRLDAETAAEVMGGLRRRGATVLLLTHDRTQAAKCDQVLRLDLGRIADGGPRQTAVHGGARHG